MRLDDVWWDGPDRVEVDVVVIVIPEIQIRARSISDRNGNSAPLASDVQGESDSQHRLAPVVHAAVRIGETRHPPRKDHRPARLGVLDVRHDRLVIYLANGHD